MSEPDEKPANLSKLEQWARRGGTPARHKRDFSKRAGQVWWVSNEAMSIVDEDTVEHPGLILSIADGTAFVLPGTSNPAVYEGRPSVAVHPIDFMDPSGAALAHTTYFDVGQQYPADVDAADIFARPVGALNPAAMARIVTFRRQWLEPSE